MKDFPNASFPPETLGIMKEALDAAIATLPDPISTAHVDFDCRNHSSDGQGRRERPCDLAANGSYGASDFTPRIDPRKVYSIMTPDGLTARLIE